MIFGINFLSIKSKLFRKLIYVFKFCFKKKSYKQKRSNKYVVLLIRISTNQVSSRKVVEFQFSYQISKRCSFVPFSRGDPIFNIKNYK
jgi:hypothetical protein